MSQEVFQMIQSMDVKSAELQLALQCAPLITGIKVSNLLMIESEKESAVRVILKHTGIVHYRLLSAKGKTAFLLFRRSQLEAYLARTEIVDILRTMGYEEFALGSILRNFQKRYQVYMSQGMQFPHEMGLLLGYPAEDVKSFIEHKGQNFLYSGYWKVYGNVSEKKSLFQQYEQSKEECVQFLAKGMNIQRILSLYHENDIQKAVV